MADQLAPLIASKMKLHPTVQKRLLDVDEAAVYLGRTPNSLRILESRKALQGVRNDGRLMFDLRDLEKWIEGGK